MRAARGTALRCKGWAQEAALRMLENNLDPDNAEKPDELIVYGGTGRAARKFAAILENLEGVLAIETLAAFQAMEFLKPLRSSAPLETLRREFRRAVRPWDRDREMHLELSKARRFLQGDAVARAIARLA